MTDLAELLDAFEGVSLDVLDERAALLRRVDRKYAVAADEFERLARELLPDHQVLQIDENRVFRYSTTYFDTADLRCFVEHIEDRLPRFKARSRLYEDSEECVFEVKLKRSEDETDKRQIDYAQEDRRRITDDAKDCLDSALGAVGLEPPGDLHWSLTTEFRRVTLTSRHGSERLTCDFGVRLIGAEGKSAAMHSGLVLVETKSEAGESPADQALERMQLRPISLSKYRVGMSLAGAAERFGDQPGSELFDSGVDAS